ncbi:hypothetical protein EON67_12425 [archaeon]|nr:MAG: hypothetical protein EON67_12425 [archaeon]
MQEEYLTRARLKGWLVEATHGAGVGERRVMTHTTDYTEAIGRTSWTASTYATADARLEAHRNTLLPPAHRGPLVLKVVEQSVRRQRIMWFVPRARAHAAITHTVAHRLRACGAGWYGVQE